jgi:hypothetical protein
MKKYLIKGALALFTGAFLFSCAEKESEYVPLAQQKVKAFDEVFHEVFGDIDPYQDWGFSKAALKLDPNDSSMVMEVIDVTDGDVASTRALTRAATRTKVDVNGNQWKKCPTLGETEENDVLSYVNHTTKWLRENNKTYYLKFPRNLTEYYVTQVHCGTDTYNNLEGNSIGTGSSHMNNLHFAETSSAYIDYDGSLSNGWFHVNNFNRGDNTDWKGNTLVTESGTCDFAYHGTEDDRYHNKWIAIDGADIDRELGVSKYAGYWYICFDFVATNNNVKTNIHVEWDKVVNENQTDKRSENIQIYGIYTIESAYSDNVTVTLDGQSVRVGAEGYSWSVTQYVEGNKCVAPNDVYTDWIVRLVPAANSVPKDVPSTTIVEYWTPLEAGRVFCEDLGRASREDLDYNDLVFDARTWKYEKYTLNWSSHYNDEDDANPATTEKGDSTLTETKYYADIKLLAAGGTIPITIADRQVHSLFVEPADVATMINTRDNNSNVYGSFDVRRAVEVGDETLGDERKEFKTKDGDSFTLWLIPGYEHIKDIPIVSAFDWSQVQELNADQGAAPHKILVEYGVTKWTSERKNLALAYPGFSGYVSGQINNSGWVKENINTEYLYDQPVDNAYSPSPRIIKSTKQIVGNAELEIWSGTQAFGSNWNYFSVDSPYDYYNVGTKFYPGDRIRFHGIVTAEGDGDQPYISVSFNDDSKPYLVDTQFAERKKRMVGDKEEWYYPSTAYVEVLLDEYFCSKLNNSKNDAGQLTLHVQGRGFTLTKIGYVQFE